MTGETLWLGRARRRGEPREYCIRVRTDGRFPEPTDRVEAIDDPFGAAHPRAAAVPDADPLTIAASAPGLPLGGATDVAMSDLELVAPVWPRKIIAVGRNYRAHAEEMGNEVPDEPLLFTKPPSCLIGSGKAMVRPRGFERVDMEAELVVVIGRAAHRVDRGSAWDHVAGLTLGNDVSNRDLQRRDKQWTRAKGFDGFGPLGPLVRMIEPGFVLPKAARIRGYVDDAMTQDAPLSAMIFPIEFVIEYVSACMTLEPGDLIFTGTPKGVTALQPGQTMRVESPGLTLGRLETPIV